MSNLKRWKERGQGEFLKWDTPGQELEGKWEGQHDGKFGPLGTIATPTGRISFPLHTALLQRIEELEEGNEIKIIYTGKQISKAGREFKAFRVFTTSDNDEELPPPRDEDIPF